MFETTNQPSYYIPIPSLVTPRDRAWWLPNGFGMRPASPATPPTWATGTAKRKDP